MIMNAKCHMEQKSKGVQKGGGGGYEEEEEDMYANKKQKAMSKALKSKKAGF